MNVTDQIITDRYSLYNGDSCQVLKGIPNNSIHYEIYSPPFESLYSYSSKAEDLGNCRSTEEFYEQFQFIGKELFRCLMPGRLMSFHCMNLPTSKTRDGIIGIRDFRGDLIRFFQEIGFIFHSEVVVWKDPLLAAVRTHALGLAHKQIVKDSAMCRQGIPDYLVTMRKPGDNPEPVEHKPRGFEKYVGEDAEPDANKTEDPRGNKYSHEVWRRYASPVWMDINQTDTLQYRSARENEDEKHICPLQLQLIERCIELWTNPNDIVLTPFLGIGSEAYMAVKAGRRAVGVELKESYFRQAVKNVEQASIQQTEASLFD